MKAYWDTVFSWYAALLQAQALIFSISTCENLIQLTKHAKKLWYQYFFIMKDIHGIFVCVDFYRAYHRFGQAKFAYGGLILDFKLEPIYTSAQAGYKNKA